MTRADKQRQAPGLDRRKVVQALLEDRRDLVVVSGLGAATYDVSAAGDHARNFYLWGAMGGAAMVGLGLSLARPDVPVCVITGDGEALMGLGGFATIALQAPQNLSIVILDNGVYGETGGQPSHTSFVTDLAAAARACGLANTLTIVDHSGIAALAEKINSSAGGPTVAIVKIDAGEKPRHLPSRDGVWLSARLRDQFGLASM